MDLLEVCAGALDSDCAALPVLVPNLEREDFHVRRQEVDGSSEF